MNINDINLNIKDDKIDTPPFAFYVPSPVLILSTVSTVGEVDLSTMSAAGVICLDPPLIAIGIKPSRLTYKNIRQTQKFAINLPLQSDLEAADYVGTRKLRSTPDKIAQSGFEISLMPRSKMPYLVECPVVMGCKVINILAGSELGFSKPSHHCVIGLAEECLVSKEWIRDDEVKLEEMPLPIYLNRYYTGLGESLGIQRFTDTEEKSAQKLKEYRSLSLNSQVQNVQK